MIEITKELKIEVSKPNLIQAIVAKQYDMNTRFLKVTLVNGTDIITIHPSKTLKVVINAKRRDGQSKAFDGIINDDGTVTVPLHSWMLELEGGVICDISVIDMETDDEKKLTTTSFNLFVEKATYGGDDVTDDPQYDILVEMLERAENVKDGASAYEIAVKNGFEGTEEEWLLSLQGKQGVQGVQGPIGKPFTVAKTYQSVDEMNADYNNPDIDIGSFVVIVSSVENEDNAKLYIKGENDYVFVVDMSGMTGIQGEQGIQGIQGVQGIQGEKGDGAIWWKDIPDSIVLHYDSDGNFLEDNKTEYSGYIMSGSTYADVSGVKKSGINISGAVDFGYEWSIDPTTKLFNLKLTKYPEHIEKGQTTNENIIITIFDENFIAPRYSKSISVFYVCDGTPGESGVDLTIDQIDNGLKNKVHPCLMINDCDDATEWENHYSTTLSNHRLCTQGRRSLCIKDHINSVNQQRVLGMAVCKLNELIDLSETPEICYDLYIPYDMTYSGTHFQINFGNDNQDGYNFNLVLDGWKKGWYKIVINQASFEHVIQTTSWSAINTIRLTHFGRGPYSGYGDSYNEYRGYFLVDNIYAR